MDNKIETFDSFSLKMRRPDRKRHVELCGFERAVNFIIFSGK
jgi:hypothetical protein